MTSDPSFMVPGRKGRGQVGARARALRQGNKIACPDPEHEGVKVEEKSPTLYRCKGGHDLDPPEASAGLGIG